MTGIDLTQRTNDSPTRGEVQRMIDGSTPDYVQVSDSNKFPNGALIWTGSDWTTANGGQAVPSNNTMPSNANNGDEWVYMAQAGVNWLFKWDTATGYWVFTGGAPAVAITDAAISNSVGSTFQDTVNPNLRTPFVGDYRVSVQALYTNNTAASIGLLSVAVNGGVTFPRNYGQLNLLANQQGTLNWVVDYSLISGLSLAANIPVSTMIWSNNPVLTNTSFSFRRIELLPLRVRP